MEALLKPGKTSTCVLEIKRLIVLIGRFNEETEMSVVIFLVCTIVHTSSNYIHAYVITYMIIWYSLPHYILLIEYSSKNVAKKTGNLAFKDRQQLVARLLRCCRFLCTYALYIHKLYIK